MNLELIAGSTQFFAPMQIIEEKVGYDVALIPGDAAVWAHLGISRTPIGTTTPISFSLNAFPVSGGVSFAASLFIQYKRAELMVAANALKTKEREKLGGGRPFFRIYLNPSQHDVLVDLENAASGDAVVRYAAPMFHQIEELWMLQSTREVFRNSIFAAPVSLGVPPSVWTYDSTGSIYCSEPRRGDTTRSEGLLRTLVGRAVSRDRVSTRDHLRTLAEAVERVDFSDRRRRELRERFPDGEEDFRSVRAPLGRDEWAERLRQLGPDRPIVDMGPAIDAAVIANAAASAGFTWLLAAVREHTR